MTLTALALFCLLLSCPRMTQAAGQASDAGREMELFPLEYLGEELRRYIGLLTDLSSNSSKLFGAASQQCRKDINQTLLDLGQGEKYALQMLDAAAKIPSGLTEGVLRFPGAYDTCINVLPVANVTSFGGRYCTANIDITNMLNRTQSASFLPTGMMATYSMCVPDSCNGNSIAELINSALEQLPFVSPLTVQSVDCAVSKPFYVGDIIALSVVGLLVFLVFSGTTFDVIYRCLRTWTLREASSILEIDGSHGSGEEEPLVYKEESQRSRGSSTSCSSVEEELGAPELGIAWRIVLCFSALINGEKILRTEGGDGSIGVLHGVRVLSIWWVILGHTVLFIVLHTDNLLTVIEMTKRFTFLAISNATFSVDSFFFMSGLLVCYLTMKKLEEHDGSINWGLFYFHRFWRLTPALGFVLMFYTAILPHLPVVPKGPGIVNDNCPQYWWATLIYINNIYPLKFSDSCIPWSWYLACDFQFFAISPLFIILLYFKPRLGVLIVCVITFLSVVGTLLISETFGLKPFATMFYLGQAPIPRNLYPVDGFDYLYSKPYTRIPAYLVGMLMGLVLHCTKCKSTYRFRIIPVTVIWMVSSATALAVVYGFYYSIQFDVVPKYEMATFYNGVARLAWSICLGWVVFASIHGIGGPVHTILSWRFWKPLSHLTYCVYLVHPIWMMIYANYLRRQVHFDDLNLIYLFIGNLVISYLIAFCVSLLVESPLLALEKIIFRTKKRPRGVWDFATDRKGYY